MISGRAVAAVLAWGFLVWLLTVSLAEMTRFWWLALIFGLALPVILLAQHNRAGRQRGMSNRHFAGTGGGEQEIAPANDEPDEGSRGERPAVVASGEERPLLDPLTEREREVLDLMASGLTSREIAGQLFVGVGTVKSHTARIYRKLGTRNRTEALARARSLGLLR